MNQLARIANEYDEAKHIIASALSEWGMVQHGAEAERTAAAIIARLAAHDPPILLEMQESEVQP